MRVLLALLAFLPSAYLLPPPPGVPLKPAKQLDAEENAEDGLSSAPPPNLSLRSRMMAALNSDPKADRIPVVSQPLILTKARKAKKTPPPAPRAVFAVPRPLATLPPTADYGVTSALRTSFVDSHGRVMHDVVSIPIRVGEQKKPSASASSALVEGESARGVQVRFGPAPLGAR